MISDILSAAVQDIDSYLHDVTFDAVYAGALRARIAQLRNEADAIRIVLDTPPGARRRRPSK
jgi:hypothetical protein